MKKNVSLIIIFLFGFLIILFSVNLKYPFKTLKVGNWSIGYKFMKDPLSKLELDSKNVISYEFVNHIVREQINYIADPFFIEENGIFYLFVELKGTQNADIALFTSKEGSDYRYEGIVLDETFHLSYPQVFKYRNEFYMLPETKQTGNVLLYKAKKFPYKWKIEDTLIRNVQLKDPSILLTPELNLIVAVDDHMNQLLYTADSLFGKWEEMSNYTPKKGNETRPGGRFFKYKDEWFLPVQDRSLGYGSGISLYKLINTGESLKLELAKKRFLKANKLIPWFNRGMHHLDIQKVGDSFYSVYDGDRNLNKAKAFQVKRSLKFVYSDIYNYFKGN